MSREYLVAGKAVDAVLRGVSFKHYCSTIRIGKIDFALACETLRYKQVLQKLCEGACVTSKGLEISCTGILYVYLYELLFGNGKIRGGGHVKRKIADVLESVKLVLANEMTLRGAQHHRDLLPASVLLAQESHRQYLRINLLKLPRGGQGENKAKIMASILAQCPGAVLDEHIPNLVALPVKAPSFGEHSLVKQGALIIQDKASCFPSQLLMDEWLQEGEGGGGDIIDACAAPGNKTTHLAAILHYASTTSHPQAEIHAFDKNSKRAELLKSRIAAAGGDSLIRVVNADFLELDVTAYTHIRHILLDPSCSGSGMTKSLDRDGGTIEGSCSSSSSDEAKRVAKLRSFQVQAILKAATFPKVVTIVYSTCSVYQEENESVVAEVLAQLKDAGWELKAPKRLEKWERRGLPFPPGLTATQSACLIRSGHEEGTIGFFVAVLIRVSTDVDAAAKPATKKRLPSKLDQLAPKKPKGGS